MQLEVGTALFAQYMALRYNVLRKPLGHEPGSEQDKDDAAHCPGVLHLAVATPETGPVVGCARLQPAPDAYQSRFGLSTVQLRYMGVHLDYQGMGLGQQLLTFAERIAAGAGTKCLVLHARATAVPFYEACGYVEKEAMAPILGIEHWRMWKTIL